MQEIYEKIVLDGSNIIHDDTGIEMKSDDGERLIQSRPERLLAAINHCESLGWTAIACLKEGTYTWAKSNADAESVGDVDLLDELIQDHKEQSNLKKIETLEQKLINNLDENSYSELIKLKSQLNRE